VADGDYTNHASVQAAESSRNSLPDGIDPKGNLPIREENIYAYCPSMHSAPLEK
jgi:hypothetical protein